MWWLIAIGCFVAYAFICAYEHDRRIARSNAKADALDNVRTVIDAAIAALERRK